ncbi:Coiled-coil domain-containing protein 90B [Chelonia mydas]|uniref:Coiled-coil domain-containing protein 90B n=1 Tax=Chelonia mydas TaxID=8469 RepID=M7BHB6_CHEMY|nr:Coiled-coil domain-containing protein 90B [Chelonia mydas]
MRRVEITPLEQRKLTFDTHALVRELEVHGFGKEQAETIVSALTTLSNLSLDTVYKDMVTQAQQVEITLQQIMAHLDSIRKDMVILEKSEFANLRAENEAYYHYLMLEKCHTTASMEPTQLTAAVMSIVNTSRIILEYEQNRAKRRQHEDDCEEDMDTDVPESMGCGNWDIIVAVGLVDTVECQFWAQQTRTDWWDRIVLQKMKIELDQVKQQLMNETSKIRADNKLDINLERSRVTDMFTDQEKNLMEATTEFHKKDSSTNSAIAEISNKIDTQIASLKTLMESNKLETIRYLAGNCVPIE